MSLEILAVDDSRTMREMIRLALEPAGLQFISQTMVCTVWRFWKVLCQMPLLQTSICHAWTASGSLMLCAIRTRTVQRPYLF